MNSNQTSDKIIMEDFDADFISDILIASDELQMADSFIEDFMGELNQKSNNQQLVQDSSLDWQRSFPGIENVPYLETDQNHQQFHAQLQHQENNNNLQYQLHIMPDQNFNNTQQLLQQAGTFSNCQSDFNNVQNIQTIQSLNNFPEFHGNEIPVMLGNNNIASISRNVNIKRGLNDLLKSDQNINTTKSANLMNAFTFESNNTSLKGVNKKQKSRSINSIINESNTSLNVSPHLSQKSSLPRSPHRQVIVDSPIYMTNDNRNFLLDQNINEKIFQINSSGMQLVLDQGEVNNPEQATTMSKSSSSSSLKENNNSEPFKLLDLSEITPRKPKFKKKTAHNAIEKKYRSSINDKILELKIRVAGPDQKLQKSGILRKTLDYLNNIEDVNSKLCNENRILRSALKKISSNPTDFITIKEALRSINYLPVIKAEQDSSLLSPNTPPNSSSSCDSDSIFESFGSPSSLSSMLSSPISPSASVSSDKKTAKQTTDPSTKPKRTYTKRAKKPEAMVETSRIMLCMFAMSILFFNPFSLILPSTPLQGPSGQFHAQPSVNSRVLNSLNLYEDLNLNTSHPRPGEETAFNLFYWLSWLLNSALVFVCLAKVYICSDPILETQNSEKYRGTLWLSYQKACRSFQRKEYFESSSMFKQGLKVLGLETPQSKLELVIGIIWQLIRLGLDKIYVGRLFFKLGSWIYGKESSKTYKLSTLFYFELHKFAYLNMKSEKEIFLSTTTASSAFSYLTGVYYTLAAYNMSEVYSMDGDLSRRDEYNLCEIYFSLVLYVKFFLPSGISTLLVKYLLNSSLLKKNFFLKEKKMTNETCKLQKLKCLLNKEIFVQFLIEFDAKRTLDLDEQQQRQKGLSLIVYKRKLFSLASFLYDSDASEKHFDPVEEDEDTQNMAVSANGIACDYILSKFQEFILFQMTNQVTNRIGAISAEKIVSTGKVSVYGRSVEDDNCDDLKELAEIDQINFNRLKDIYKENLDYFLYSKSKFSSSVIQETQLTLIQFLKMTNSWKLRKFYADIQIDQLKNSSKSDFIESVISVLKAYNCILTKPKSALDHCIDAADSLRKFNEASSMNSSSELVEKFKLLINDWLLSAQSHLWTEHSIKDIGLFNQNLKEFQNLIVDLPELNFKAKMYETILMYASNRNPINLLNPTAKQTVFTNCNQEAFYSMKKILKSFRLQITE